MIYDIATKQNLAINSWIVATVGKEMFRYSVKYLHIFVVKICKLFMVHIVQASYLAVHIVMIIMTFRFGLNCFWLVNLRQCW